jgi:prevent-host-death family protein
MSLTVDRGINHNICTLCTLHFWKIIVMSIFNATDGQNSFFDLIDRAHHQERIAIEHHGKLVAAIVSYEDLARLEALEDAIATAQLKQAMADSTGLLTAAELLAMRSIDDNTISTAN